MTKTRNDSPEELHGWFAGRLPDGWFTEAPEVTTDRDEILAYAYHKERGLPTIVVRLFNTVGPRQSPAPIRGHHVGRLR